MTSGAVQALDLGADDYVTKPSAWANSWHAFARPCATVSKEGAPAVFTNGDLTVDLTRRLVTARGQEVKLSNKEWDILKLLVVHAGKVLTHRMIMEQVWGPTVDVQHCHLRAPTAPETRGVPGSTTAHPH